MVKLNKEYKWSTKVPSYFAEHGVLSISGQLKMQEIAGNRLFTEIGIPYDELIKNGLAFVIIKTTSTIFKLPKENEKITVRTAHMDTKGFHLFRYYIFEDEKGKRLLDSISDFALINPKTHKLLLASAFDVVCEAAKVEAPILYSQKPRKVNVAKNAKKTGEKRVSLQSIDYNQHVNNAVYGNYISECLQKLSSERKKVTINYNQEALLDDIIELFELRDENEIVISGNHARGKCFSAKIEF